MCISSSVDDVLFIYEWFMEAVASLGGKIRKTRCSDIRKTYQYRTVTKFVDESKKIGLDREQMQLLVKEIVKYAKDKNLLRRGTAILTMVDIFEICCRRIEVDLKSVDQFLDIMRDAKNEITTNMHCPVAIGGYSKLTCLIKSGKLPIELVAVSKRCNNALHSISQDERTALPSDVDLLRTRISILIKADRRLAMKQMLGDDLLENGVPL